MSNNSVWYISYAEIFYRMILAGVLGGFIGWERERNNHPAGFRTHTLVSLGSGLITLISIYGFVDFVTSPEVKFDPSRICAQIVSGIGFLGAGTIFRHGSSVSGLTTAASLWVVAAVGLAAGAGFYFPAVLVTILAWICLEFLDRFEAMDFKGRSVHVLRVNIRRDVDGRLDKLSTLIAQRGGKIRKIKIVEMDEREMIYTFHIKMKDSALFSELCEEIGSTIGVKKVKMS